MQNYFGMVIRRNTAAAWNNDQAKTLYSMKKGVLVVLWHCTDLQILKIDLYPVQDNIQDGVNIGKQSKTTNLLSVSQ